MSGSGDRASITWRDRDGLALTCLEKLKVLSENLSEVQALAQDVFEEALLLQVDEAQIRAVLRATLDDLENPYA